MDYYDLSDKALLAEIGRRVQRHRLNKNMTQIKVARLSGSSRNTVQALESGKSINLRSFLRILRAMEALDALDALIADPGFSPLEAAKLLGRRRQRASGSSGHDTGSRPTW